VVTRLVPRGTDTYDEGPNLESGVALGKLVPVGGSGYDPADLTMLRSHQIAPKYKSHSENKKYNEITFTRCDVDVAEDVAAQFGISAMPTFVLLKGKKVVDSVRGANPPALERALDGLLKEGEGKSTTSFPGQGQTLA